MKNIISLISAVLLLQTACCAQENAYQVQYPKQDKAGMKLPADTITAPAGTIFSAVLINTVSSKTAKAGDAVSMYLPSDLCCGRYFIANEGSRLNGAVIQAVKGGYKNRQGQLQIKFNNIITPYGQIIPVSAGIKTLDGTGILKEGNIEEASAEYIKNAPHADLNDTDSNIKLPKNAYFNIVLDQPATAASIAEY